MKTKGSNWFLQECPLYVAEVVFVKNQKLVGVSHNNKRRARQFFETFHTNVQMIFLKKEQKFTCTLKTAKFTILWEGENSSISFKKYIWTDPWLHLVSVMDSTDIENFRRMAPFIEQRCRKWQ